MFRYSEDSFAGRALNWTLIAGAALMFAAITYGSVTPSSQNKVQPLIVTTQAPAGSNG